MAWLNLTMANQTVKNGLKAKKITLPQFFILHSFKKIIRADLELLGCAIFGPRMAHFSEQNFFSKNQFCYFHLSISPFHCARLKKILRADAELWRCAIFGPKMVYLPQTNYFWKVINIIFIHVLAPFIVQNFKKILPADPEFWGCAIFGPKMAHFPKWNFL